MTLELESKGDEITPEGGKSKWIGTQSKIHTSLFYIKEINPVEIAEYPKVNNIDK